jgi:thiamine biosynthesis lipoprotein
VALSAAAATDGLVDPTLGSTMRALGYDRDFRSVPPDGPPIDVHLPDPRPGRWRQVRLDPAARTARLPHGVELDLGATAKAWAADRAAAAAAAAIAGSHPEVGVLVDLGGDVALGGVSPPGGWPVLVTDDHATAVDATGQCVALFDGGLATSGLTVRTWHRGGQRLHHLVDPRTGLPVEAVWRTATVAAESCRSANIAATAALVLGETAPTWLAEHHLPARLVRPDGRSLEVGSWPRVDGPAPDHVSSAPAGAGAQPGDR